MRSTIICVDDDKWILNVLAEMLNERLGNNYFIEKALSGPEALDILDTCLEEGTEVSLIISDYIMPEMKGDVLLEQIKNKSPITRRIMLTGFAALDGIANAINKAGIYRFIAKPWDNKDLMLTVLQAIRSYEQDKQAEKLAKSHKELYHKFQDLASEMQNSWMQAVGSLSAAVEVREGVSPGHSERVAGYATRIAKALQMSENDVKILETAALLHDTGKLGLRDEELEALRGPQCYERNDLILRQAEQAKIIMSRMDMKIRLGVIYHMERADGLGAYGMRAGSIPLDAKIIGLSNYFDIASETRPESSPSDILKSLLPKKGKIFDVEIFDWFADILEK